MTIDPRLLERRAEVAEDNAKRNVARLLRFLVVVTFVGALAWLFFSPWMSVHQVRVAGIVASDGNETLVGERVVAGTPMILLRPGRVEAALEQDPWIRDARVHLDWPDEVIVRVDERVPVIWVERAEGWSRHAIDGVELPGATAPGADLPRLHVSDITASEMPDSTVVLGAAEFAAVLPPRLRRGTSLHLESGELWAEVAGYQVRLGRPVEMEAKALSLTALLTEDLEPGSTLVLVAPSHPAVEQPVPLPAEGDDGVGDDESSEAVTP